MVKRLNLKINFFKLTNERISSNKNFRVKGQLIIFIDFFFGLIKLFDESIDENYENMIQWYIHKKRNMNKRTN